jgi:hypothetical protein
MLFCESISYTCVSESDFRNKNKQDVSREEKTVTSQEEERRGNNLSSFGREISGFHVFAHPPPLFFPSNFDSKNTAKLFFPFTHRLCHRFLLVMQTSSSFRFKYGRHQSLGEEFPSSGGTTETKTTSVKRRKRSIVKGRDLLLLHHQVVNKKRDGRERFTCQRGCKDSAAYFDKEFRNLSPQILSASSFSAALLVRRTAALCHSLPPVPSVRAE